VKYSSWPSFVAHLEEALPHHPAPAYLLVVPDAGERLLLLRQMARKMQLKLIQLSEEELAGALLSPSLFAERQLFLLDQVEKLKGAVKEALLSWLKAPTSSVHLLLGSGSGKQTEELLEKGKRSLVALDLGQEKPWDREKRLKAQLLKKCYLEGVQIAPEALELLVQRLGLDALLLERELEKLCCYAKESGRIAKEDVDLLTAQLSERSGWQTAEALVWKGERLLGAVSDLSELLSLVGQLRYHLQIGACLAESGGENAGPDAGNLRPNQFAEYSRVAHAKGSAFFLSALEDLFEMELTAKSSSLPAAVLWDRFVGAR